MTKETVVAVSGGFSIIHVGHIFLFEAAKKLGDKLVVILNNDNWLKKKYGQVVVKEEERKLILEKLTMVDEVVLTGHSADPKDMSVCRELEDLNPDIFANGGDRHDYNTPEYQTCLSQGIVMKFNVGGGKVNSSSWIMNNAQKPV
ncbi:MAG: adenylyltransferase/cytidyltransferase family protein [bacterium]|nr:adenylyltransferase/cytidyltransferase family protein [bacterium]